MAQWKIKPEGKVIIHSDRGSQLSSDKWNRFCRDHNLEPSMSRRIHYCDNTTAESFFSSLKNQEKYTKQEKLQDVIFLNILVFFITKKGVINTFGNISPIDFEKKILENKVSTKLRLFRIKKNEQILVHSL